MIFSQRTDATLKAIAAVMLALFFYVLITFMGKGERFTHKDGKAICAALNELREIHNKPLLCCETFNIAQSKKSK